MTTVEERLQILQERLKERRATLVQVQRECFQLEGAIFALGELLSDSTAANGQDGEVVTVAPSD